MTKIGILYKKCSESNRLKRKAKTLTTAGMKMVSEYPYRHTTETNFKVASYCLNTSQIKSGAIAANPYTSEEAVNTDWKSYCLQNREKGR